MGEIEVVRRWQFMIHVDRLHAQRDQTKLCMHVIFSRNALGLF